MTRIEVFTSSTAAVITEGTTTKVTCEALGYPPPTIVWSRNNGALSDRVSVSDSVSVPTGYGNVTRVSINLTITNASREDAGVYMCSANNGVGNDERNMSITVQCKCNWCIESYHSYFTVHPVTLSEITDISDESRDTVNFTCIATGEPVPNISWYFNIVMINISSKYLIMSELINATTVENTLTILNAVPSDVGVYTCTASNILGNDTSHG